MDIIIRRKILKFTIIIAFIFTFIFLVGCSNTNNTLKTLSNNMDKVINDINKVETIDNNSLIIDDFIDVNNPQFYTIDTPALYQTSTDKIDNYILKIKLLNNSIYNTIEINNMLNSLKKQVVSKAHQVKSLCDQCVEENCKIDNKILDTLEELNNSVMSNASRIYLSRNEIKNYIGSINQIKHQYNSKSEQLASRYEKLQGGLNTRLTYYVNINDGLNSIAYAITANTSCERNSSNYNIDCDNCLENNNQEHTIKTNANKENHKWLKKNIDTYENAGKDIYGFNKRYYPSYNQDNYLNGYGYYGNPNFYGNGYGYGAYGFGNIYNPSFGMPFGYGYGMTYPNINTFGTYKNVDTYKSQQNPYIQKNDYDKDANNNSSNGIDEKSIESSISISNNNNDVLTRNPNQKLPKPLLEDNENNDIKKMPPRPMPKPYIPHFKPEKPIYDDNDKYSSESEKEKGDETTSTINEPKTLEYIKDNQIDDGEDKFVSSTLPKPQIEKLEK